DGDRGCFAEFCSRFLRFLHVRHDGEEQIVFPKLTEVAARASLPEFASEVTGWRAAHEKLLGHLSAFETATTEFRAGGSHEKLHLTAGEVRDVLFPHLATEESALNAAGLAKLLRPDEVLALEVASAEHGKRVGGPAVLMLLVHALSDEEQQAHFSEMPWLVRKLLLKRIWSRSFSGCLKYAHNASIAL